MDASGDNRLPPPAWIDRTFVSAVLDEGSPSGRLSVDTVLVEHANKPGAGYASLMFRVKATVRNGEDNTVEQRSLVVKTIHVDGAMKEVIEQDVVFETEGLVLAEVVPALHEAMQPVEGTAFRPLAAKCLRSGTQPAPYLVLEDLVAAGFRLADAGRPLDYAHCELVMRNYARLHAASVHLLSARPDYGQRLSIDGFAADEAKEVMEKLYGTIISAAAEFMTGVDGYEKYAPKYKGLMGVMQSHLKEALDHKKEDTKLRVLLHGDCWKNNMMFKYSEGKLAEVRLVDFQLTHASSPARDLQYFLYANASLDVHEQRMEELLGVYHSQLQASLRALGQGAAADRYPLTELRRDLDDLDIFALFTGMLSGFVLASERVGDEFARAFREMNFDDNLLHGIYDNEYSQSYMIYLSRLFESKGLL